MKNNNQRPANSEQRPTPFHRALAVIALLAGLLAAISGTPYRAQPISALELAQWIHDHKPGLRIVDVRNDAAFAEYHIPRSEHVTGPLPARAGETLVIIDDARTSDNGRRTTNRDQRPAISDQRILYLRGGMGEWLSEVMSPVQSSELTRYFGGQPRAGNSATPTPHTIRRRGC